MKTLASTEEAASYRETRIDASYVIFLIILSNKSLLFIDPVRCIHLPPRSEGGIPTAERDIRLSLPQICRLPENLVSDSETPKNVSLPHSLHLFSLYKHTVPCQCFALFEA